ncbi:serine/threonine-protein phosphatase 7 long form [Tanacetum coccineum]|uniref:Serine/threonine-protein phosphatase 7 long form n=1 Tax=Tanacetum coccineum TaxID=301880 RepID=A0ABQ5IB94_9ASTR
MANLQATPLPRIHDLLWLQAQDKHRAYAVFNQTVDDGPAVSGTWLSADYADWVVQQQPGFIPLSADINTGKTKINVLIDYLSDALPINDLAYQQRARIYILALLGGHLFSDSSSYEVTLNYLQNIQDLNVEGRSNWGIAVLAYLYKNLCNTAGDGHIKGIQGPLLLLHLWHGLEYPIFGLSAHYVL